MEYNIVVSGSETQHINFTSIARKRVRLVSTNFYVESYQAYEGVKPRPASPRGPFLRLWWADSINPVHRRDPDIMGGVGMTTAIAN
jgi:hypothetical protein